MFQVIADLEEERRKHAEDTAEGDDVTYILEKERERLHQQVIGNRFVPTHPGEQLLLIGIFFELSCALQLEFERCQVRRLEKEQRRMTEQLEEERAQHKHLSCALAKECKWASARALEEGHRLTELSRKLDKVASDPPGNSSGGGGVAWLCLVENVTLLIQGLVIETYLQMAPFKESQPSFSHTGEGDLSGSEKGAGGREEENS